MQVPELFKPLFLDSPLEVFFGKDLALDLHPLKKISLSKTIFFVFKIF